MSTENEVCIGGINSETMSGDIRLDRLYDEGIGCDTGERVGPILIPEPAILKHL
jgi:hypothetical protein